MENAGLHSSTGSTSGAAVPLTVMGEPGDAALAREIKALVIAARKIVISGHERPDGDCIGSEVALCSALRDAGKDCVIVNSDPTPSRFAFLDPDKLIQQARPGEKVDADLVIVVDSTDLSRLGKLKREQFGDAKLINIDHHLNNPNFGVVNFVDTKAAASGELVWRLVSHAGWSVSPAGLNALYIAIVTDTGQFAYSNTSPRVLRMAAELIEKGVNPEAMWRRIYLNRTEKELALEAIARSSLECASAGRICVVALSHADFIATGTGPQHTEEFATIPRSLEGVEVAMLLYEVNGGKDTKVSFRTSPGLDACALAQQFGGGGHRQAAGCTIPVPLVEAKRRVLEAAERLLGVSS
jgi:phosphoesterase RecJ-like protein